MKRRKKRYFVGDFETTVYEGQEATEVWAAACVEMFTEDVHIFHSIGEQFEFFKSIEDDVVCYYHNLKFDGSFWMSYLLIDEGFEQAYDMENDADINTLRFRKAGTMKNNTFSYSISNMGQWYRMIIKVSDKYIEFRDSLKLLPFSVKKIGRSFKTKHQKLDMEYKGFRYAGCEITPEEQQYISNDILVVKEALEIMFTQGHNKLTIGACCLSEFRKITGYGEYTKLFPNLYQIPLDEADFGSPTVGDYVKMSYHGGWCYVARGKENKVFDHGTTADVNSLYPSMMSSESGNRYPIGDATFWKGDFIPEEAVKDNRFYFVRIRTRFHIKENCLPFIQIKNTVMYKANEMLETSDVRDKYGVYHSKYRNLQGEIQDAAVTMTLTMTDYQLLLKHYDLCDMEILDGCYFDTAFGLFDEYIEKYKKIKLESTGALRELAKLFLNNLYGKMASTPTSNFKVAFVKDDRSIGYYTVLAKEKTPGYIPIGSAITSYARNFTIRAAQLNYHGIDKPGFIYADTDSIHCDLYPDEIVGAPEDPKKFCHWKYESCWDQGYFSRQKTYIEHIIKENREDVEPYYNVKCAGMPEHCKDLFVKSMQGYVPKPEDNFSEDELEFLKTKRDITDFKVGLLVPGKLVPRRIPGGVLLAETTYEMR